MERLLGKFECGTPLLNSVERAVPHPMYITDQAERGDSSVHTMDDSGIDHLRGPPSCVL